MKLTLKPWTTEDAERLSDVFNSSRRDYTSNRRPTPYPVREAQRWLDETAKKDETEGLFYAILADEEYVGFITVERMEDPGGIKGNRNLGSRRGMQKGV